MAHQPAKLEAAHSAAHYGLIPFATSQFEHVRGEGHATHGVVTLNRPPASLRVRRDALDQTAHALPGAISRILLHRCAEILRGKLLHHVRDRPFCRVL